MMVPTGHYIGVASVTAIVWLDGETPILASASIILPSGSPWHDYTDRSGKRCLSEVPGGRRAIADLRHPWLSMIDRFDIYCSKPPNWKTCNDHANSL